VINTKSRQSFQNDSDSSIQSEDEDPAPNNMDEILEKFVTIEEFSEFK